MVDAHALGGKDGMTPQLATGGGGAAFAGGGGIAVHEGLVGGTGGQ